MWVRLTAMPIAVLLVTGCASRAQKVEIPIDMPAGFSRTGEAPTPERFWTAFGDPRLNRLVTEALQSNLDLESGWYRLREARAIAEREGAPLIPEVGVLAESQIRHPQPFQADNLRLGLVADYEIDLWGRLRSQRAAARYRARATAFDYRTLSLSIAAEVCRTWFQLLEAQAQVELLSKQIETNEKILTLLESQYGAGQIRAVDILRQRRLAEATRAQKLAAEATRSVIAHQLAVLLGRPPRAAVMPRASAMPEVPAVPELGLPAKLIARRPDVQQAYSLLLAADRDMASAISDRYPRLSLSAAAGTRQGSGTTLFKDWFASLVGSVLAPIIDGGRRAAEVERTEAIKMQRLYEYGQAALIGFREVEDALVREQKQLQRVESIETQVHMARQTYQQLYVEYLNGVADYIDVLTALTSEQQLRRDLLEARRAALELRVALYRALGGGFDRQDPDREAGVRPAREQTQP